MSDLRGHPSGWWFSPAWWWLLDRLTREGRTLRRWREGQTRGAFIDGAMTDDELHAMDLTAELMNTLSRVVGGGRTRDQDINEIAGHVHVIQHMIMAQAAARCYPNRFRLLGESFGD